MNQRKTMKLWQMLVLVFLLAALLVTIFLPAYHINGKAIAKMYNKLMSSDEFEDQTEVFDDSYMDERIKQGDEWVQQIEEENGIKIASISPGRIMTHSFTAFMGEEVDENEEVMERAKASYDKLRVILWIVYILAIVVILLLILGFCLKWTKYIALTISAVSGVAIAVIFGIWQFLPSNSLAESVHLEKFMEVAAGFQLKNEHYHAMLESSMRGKLFGSFWGIAFLIGFIIALLFVIMSVVSLFVGNANKVVQGPGPADDEIWRNQQAEIERQRREQEERARAERERQKQREREEAEKLRKQQEAQAAQAAPPMGQIVCTKGIASGQGFSLPEDRKVVVGKSSQNANLIINDPHVSNVHCSIRYKAATRSYIIKDHSSNGTFVNGVRLQKEVAMEFPSGTVLQLADGKNEITLG